MKFSALALATLSVLSVVESRRTLGGDAIQRHLNTVDQRSFLKHARKLQNENDEQSDFELTGQYSVRFNSCVSVELDDEQGRDNKQNNQNSQYYEQATAVKEMLIVDLVSSDSSVPNQEIAMDIGTYVNSVGRMVYEQVESYCGVCKEIEETCLSQEQGGQTNWLADQASKYFKTEQGSTVEYVDCETCELYNCIGGEENDGGRKLNQNEEGYDMESAFNYLEEVSQCQAYSVNYQNSEYVEDNGNGEYNQDEDQEQNSQSLYIGYMCSEYGTGIELSFFLDEDCTLATNEISVAQNVPENSMAGQYLQMSQNLVNGIFENSFSCSNIEFADPSQNQGSNNNTWYNFQYYGNNADGDEEESVPEANAYCQSIFEAEDTMAIECQGMMSSVANGNWMSWMNGGNSAENATASNEAAEEAQYDEDDVCAAIRSTSKTAWSYRQNNNNNNNNFYGSSGNNYGNYGSYNNNGNSEQQTSGYDYRSFGQNSEQARAAASGDSAGAILMYVGVAAAVIAAVAFFTQKKKESNEAKKQSLILEGDAGDYKAEGEIA